MTDEYGSSVRDAMKRSMEKPAGDWRPLNRRRRSSDRYGYDWFSSVVAIAITVLVVIIVVAQIGIWKGWIK